MPKAILNSFLLLVLFLFAVLCKNLYKLKVKRVAAYPNNYIFEKDM
jgi:hypothetical protein